MTTEVKIDLERVTKRYGSKTAVRDVSLQVVAGEVFAFLGPNGAGKTTTIKLMAGLLLPDHGIIRVCGQVVGANGVAARARIAYIPDQPFLYEKLTGREFLEFVREMYAVPKEAARLRLGDLDAQLGLAGLLDQLCESYSHGMKQRLVFAAALLHDPEVLVVDEPMVGLDPKTVRVVKDLFRDRVRQGKTIFMSTHTLEIAEQVADRIGIIHKGDLIRVGTFAQLQSEFHQQGTLEEVFLRLTQEE